MYNIYYVIVSVEPHESRAPTPQTAPPMFGGVTLGLVGHWWCRPHHSVQHTHTHTCSRSLISLSSLSVPSPWQMAASQPATPAKACELKVIPSRFEELPEPPWWGRTGGGVLHPPASQARGHLAGTLWNGALRRQPPPTAATAAERNRTEIDQTSGRLPAGLCLHLCGNGRGTGSRLAALLMNHGSKVGPGIL